MGRGQDIFDRACKSYDKAIELVKGMDGIYQGAMKKSGGSGYDPKITLAQFDWTL